MAVRAAPVVNNIPPPANEQAARPIEEHGTPYAYSQPSGYDFEPFPAAQPPLGGRMFLIIGAMVLALCCVFACGILFGFEIIPDILQFTGMGGPAGPTPRPTPTPVSLLPIIHYVFGI